jgi:hypothetical protein
VTSVDWRNNKTLGLTWDRREWTPLIRLYVSFKIWIIIIITTGKPDLFDQWSSLENCQICHPVFTSLDFATIILFFFYRKRSSAMLSTPNSEDQVLVLISPSDRVAQLYPQAPCSLFVAFCDSQSCGGGILPRLHTAPKIWILLPNSPFRCNGHYRAYRLSSESSLVLPFAGCLFVDF